MCVDGDVTIFSGIQFNCSKKGPLKVPMGVNSMRTPTADLINLPDLSPGWNTIADVTLTFTEVLYTATPKWKERKSITPTEPSEDNLKKLLHPQELLAAQ